MKKSQAVCIPYQDAHLAGTIDFGISGKKPTVLFLNGSRPSDRHSFSYIAESLTAHDISCLRFDYEGHGESPGNTECSIAELTAQAYSALALLDPSQPITLIASSLGGHMALELLVDKRIETVIFLAPAAYSKSFITASYTERSICYNIANADQQDYAIFDHLKDFRGRMMHIIGSDDTVIPSFITKKYAQSSVNVSEKEFHVLEGCDHVIRLWLATRPLIKEAFLNSIIQFMIRK